MWVFEHVVQFLTVDLWRLKVEDLAPRKAMFVKMLRVLGVSVRDFRGDKVTLRASALTFYTLMSIVPILAMTFGIAKGFGFEEKLSSQLREALPNQQDVVENLIMFSNQLLAQTRGGLIAGIGLIVLIWTVVKMLGNIEESFNAIWGIHKGRPLLRKFSDYLSFLFVSPILFFASSSVTVFVSAQLENLIERFGIAGAVAAALTSGMRLLSLVILWALFSFTYVFMPNTKVRLKSAVAAGIFAGTLFFLLQLVYVRFQIGVGRANAIYGSFAALPLFLTWLQLSWIVVLFGAEVAWAHQHLDRFEWGQESKSAARVLRRKVELGMMRMAVRRFCEAEPPPTYDDFREAIDAPRVLLQNCVEELKDARLLSETLLDEKGMVGFQPAADVSDLTVADVLTRLDSIGDTEVPISGTDEMVQAYAKVDEMRKELRALDCNRLLKEL
ncbi:MAG: rane protein [Candidatus Sumerlaeota bacterium]|nr:rane protein [Candidatus Sumerlaeota bacterium]